tara:strand:- start:8993 stop:10291 length:1299 start_codon:yes stop_codon:yes gene_type:complete
LCGIVGVIGDIGYKEKKAFKDMLHMDILRGSHSIGVASATLAGDFSYHKRAMLPTDFFQLKETGKVLNNVSNVCLIGHNRYATVGAVNNNTAHPFECGSLLGVHNGTLKTRSNLLDYKDFGVDSENLYHDMNTNGVDETFQRLNVNQLNAWSLAWMDKDNGTFNLLRNDERPMCYCLSQDGKTLFYASEWWMLEGALWRNNIAHQTVYITNVDELYTFHLPTVKGGQVEFTQRKLEYTPPAPVVKEVPKPSGNNKKLSLEDKKNVYKDLISYRNKTVYFVVDVLPREDLGKDFFDCSLLSGSMVGGLDVSVRIYVPSTSLKSNPKKKALYQRLANSVGYFHGDVKKVSYNGGEPYLVIDWRTVVEEEQFDLSELDLGDTNGNTYEQDDCAWCSDPLVKGEYTIDKSCSAKFCDTCVNDKATNQTLINMGYEL